MFNLTREETYLVEKYRLCPPELQKAIDAILDFNNEIKISHKWDNLTGDWEEVA